MLEKEKIILKNMYIENDNQIILENDGCYITWYEECENGLFEIYQACEDKSDLVVLEKKDLEKMLGIK